jgi:hypothetical protein
MGAWARVDPRHRVGRASIQTRPPSLVVHGKFNDIVLQLSEREVEIRTVSARRILEGSEVGRGAERGAGGFPAPC